MTDDIGSVYAKLDKLDLRTIVSYCIDSEKAAITFYTGIKGATKGNALVSQVFDNIVRDETAHHAAMVQLHKELFGTPKHSPAKGLPPFESSAKATNVATLINALNTAMQNESNAARVYKYCSHKFPEHSSLFKQHATMERMHYETLKAQRDLYEQEVAEMPGLSAKRIDKALKNNV